MPTRVNRLMQKVRWPKDIVKPTVVRVPGLRLTFDEDASDDLELSFMEAQVLMSRTAVKYLGKPYRKEMDVEELQSGDEIIPLDDVASKVKEKEQEPETETEPEKEKVKAKESAKAKAKEN